MLNIDKNNKLKIDAEELIGKTIAVLGISGSGKTNCAMVLADELLSSGFTTTIIDSEGEWSQLKTKHKIHEVHSSYFDDRDKLDSHARAIARYSVEHKASVLLNVSNIKMDIVHTFLKYYLDELLICESQYKENYFVVIEECQLYAPQNKKTEINGILSDISLRGRKRGLGLMIVSQRSARVDKDLLSQSSAVFLMRVRHPIDINIYKQLIPKPPKEVVHAVSLLKRGQSIVLFNDDPMIVNIRQY